MANLRANNLTGTGGRNAIDGSLFFDERHTRLDLDGSSDLAFGTGDFTIEMWIKIDDDTNTNTLYDSRPSGSNGAQVALFYSGSGNAILFAHGGTVRITGTVDVGKDHSWHHIALTRASGSTKLFVDGIQDGSTYSSDTTDYLNPANRPRIGSSSGSTDLAASSSFKGYISNVRVNKGTALYTANFTPPTEKLKPIDGTVLLCCQDSDDPTQEATGKTITGFGAHQRADDVELITNGTFNSATTGWTAVSGATLSVSGGKLVITGDGTGGGGAAASFTTVIGKRYILKYDVANGTISAGQIRIGTSANGYQITYDNNVSESANVDIIFTATSTTTYITLGLNSGIATSGSFKYDNVSVTLIDGFGNSSGSTKVLPPVGVDEGVVFEGDTKVNSQGYMYFPTGDTTQRGRGRGVLGGGDSQNTRVGFIDIQSQGTANEFGQLTFGRLGMSACASSTRILFCGGYDAPANTNIIDFFTIPTTSNATDFGNLNVTDHEHCALSNQTRGLIIGGTSSLVQIDYVTIAQAANALDFADMSTTRRGATGGASPTRGLFCGSASPQATAQIDYVTIASQGTDSQDFGDLSVNRGRAGSVSSSVRTVIAGGYMPSSPNLSNTIDFVTIASLGDAIDFGDLSFTASQMNNGMSNNSRGVFVVTGNPSAVNNLEFITITTTGNSNDFGDAHQAQNRATSGSDSHGGLS